jgi:hypothetical protein
MTFGGNSSNFLSKMGIGLWPGEGFGIEDILAPGRRIVTEEIPKYFETPEMPTIPESSMPQATDTSAARKAAEAERKAALLRRGRSSTILAGQSETLGLPNTKKPTLLGGG